jgi:hypothetical protein
VQAPRGDGLFVEDLQGGLHGRVGAERRAAGEQLVQDGAEGVDVGGGAYGPVVAARLLGGHVARGAQHGAALGESAVAFEALGEAEVGDLGEEMSHG